MGRGNAILPEPTPSHTNCLTARRACARCEAAVPLRQSWCSSRGRVLALLGSSSIKGIRYHLSICKICPLFQYKVSNFLQLFRIGSASFFYLLFFIPNLLKSRSVFLQDFYGFFRPRSFRFPLFQPEIRCKSPYADEYLWRGQFPDDAHQLRDRAIQVGKPT